MGEVWIDVALSPGETEIELDAQELAIGGAWIDGLPCAWRLDGDRLVLSPGAQLGNDVQVRVAFTARIGLEPRGLYAGPGFVASQFQPGYARRAFPCFDDPRFRTPFEVVVTTAAADRVVCNARPIRRETVRDRQTACFEQTPPLPTYLVTVMAGAFHGRSADTPDGPVTLHTLGSDAPGDFALETARKALELYRSWFGAPAWTGKLDLLALPQTGPAGMENTGAILLRGEEVLIDPALATPDALRNAATLIFHEVAHQWFGGLVTPIGWGELWLNEGLATWLAAKALAVAAPELANDAGEVLAIRQALAADEPATAQPLRSQGEMPTASEDAFDLFKYRKGAGLLRMLEGWLGEAAMREGLSNYLRAHALETASAQDLWQALGSAASLPVGEVARPFVGEPGAPTVRFEACGREVLVRQDLATFRTIPLRLRAVLENGEVQDIRLLLDRLEDRLAFDGPVRQLCGNAGAEGYYRAAYATGQWPAPEALTDSEATVVLEDAWLALAAGELDLLQYLDLAQDALSHGRGLLALAPKLDDIRELLAGGARQAIFDRWVCRSVRGDGDVAGDLRVAAGDPVAIDAALATVRNWLDTGAPPQGLGQRPLTACRFGDEPLFDRVEGEIEAALQRGAAAPDRLLGALAAFRLPTRAGVQTAWLSDDRLSRSSRAHFAEALLANPVSRKAAWHQIRDGRDWRESGLSGWGGRGVLPGLGAFTDRAMLEEISQCLPNPAPPQAGPTLARIASRAAFRQVNQFAFDAWLMNLSAPTGASSDVRADQSVLGQMVAGFSGALEQALLFERFGLAPPQWMHSTDDLRRALGEAEKLFLQSFAAPQPLSKSAMNLGARLQQDLEAAASVARRDLGRLGRANGAPPLREIAAAFARASATRERGRQCAVLLAHLGGRRDEADGLRGELDAARAESRRAKAWAVAGDDARRMQAARLALAADAALCAGDLAHAAHRLRHGLTQPGGPPAQPDPADVGWQAYGMDGEGRRRWAAAGFVAPRAAAAWHARGFKPSEAVRLSASGADPRALKLRPAPRPDARVAVLSVGGRRFRLEVAADEASRTQGLMHRDSVAPSGGMLFVFPDERVRPFFMHDVRIPLDIIWLGPDCLVRHLQSEAAPWDPRPLPAKTRLARCRYVVELAGGAAAAAGISLGDRLDISGLQGLTVS